MHVSAISCHHALAAVSRSAAEQASLGARRHAAASLAFSTMPRTSSNHRRRRLVCRAAIDIPPYALVHPEATQGSNNNNGINREWGIEPATEGNNKVKLWFQITGVEKSEVQDQVEVNLPLGSNVLTIKNKKQTTNPDERLDVRLLLTEEYDTKGIEVKGKKEGGKVRLEMTIVQKTISPKIIDIN